MFICCEKHLRERDRERIDMIKEENKGITEEQSPQVGET